MKTKKTASLLLAACMVLTLAGHTVLAAKAKWPVTIHVMDAAERNEFEQQAEGFSSGTLHVSKNNASGTNGSVGAAFTADKTGMAIVLTSVPGAVNYNIQLYAGKPGEGQRVSNYATADVNNGVYFTGLEVGTDYYIKVSSSTLTANACTAVYQMTAFDAMVYDNTISATDSSFTTDRFTCAKDGGNALRFWFRNDGAGECVIRLYKVGLFGSSKVKKITAAAGGAPVYEVYSNPGGATFYMTITCTTGGAISGQLRANQLDL